MRTALNLPTVIEHDNLITIADGAQAMRDDHAGAPAPPQAVVNAHLTHGIQRTGSFIEKEHGRIVNKGASDFQALPLAAAEVLAALLHPCVIAEFPAHNLTVNQRVLSGCHHLFVRHCWVPHRQIVVYRCGKQKNLLVHNRD